MNNQNRLMQFIFIASLTLTVWCRQKNCLLNP